MKTPSNKKIWRKNFSIQNTHYQMGTPAILDFFVYQPKVFNGIFKESVWVQKGDDNIGTYFPISELRAIIEKAILVIKTKPALVDKIHQETISYVQDYTKYAQSLLRIDLNRCGNQELGKIYNQLLHFQIIHHAWSIATTWFVDSDGEDFSKLLLKRAESIASGSRYEMVDVFSTLTTPSKPSMAIIEELAAWQIVKEIKANKKSLAIFSQKDTSKIESDLRLLSPVLKRKISNHFKKWCWQPFTYTGPAYDLSYYLALWSGWIREGINPTDKIKELKNYSLNVNERKREILKNLKINFADRKLFQIAADIIYLKAYRKDGVFFGMYVLDKLLREIGNRLNLSIKQTRMIAYWEMPTAIRRGYFSADILNARREFSVYYQKGRKGAIYTGAKARKFLAGLNIEKEIIKKVSTISGTVACPGQAKGIVKIVNLPEEMGKMNKGDIMVAHTTFPSLVPAMKKAAAIVTDDGGITCHAAIVSRELKTPCIVGTKIATQILHDGDKVEVDAGQGTIRKIK